jgi:hypothetical protein
MSVMSEPRFRDDTDIRFQSSKRCSIVQWR